MKYILKNPFKKIEKVAVAILCLVLVAFFVTYSCEKYVPKEEPFPANITPILVGNGELCGEKNITKQHWVIKTQEEWNKLVNIIGQYAEMNIDFSKDQIIAVFDKIKDGEWNTDIEFARITEYADSIVVSYTNFQNGNLADIITYPYNIVKIPASDKAIVFYESDTVPYKPCPCEELDMKGDALRGEVYLFKNYVPKKIDFPTVCIEVWGLEFENCFLVFNSETENANLTLVDGSYGLPIYGDICNFPNFAKKWNIPQNGCKIYIEGTTHPVCYSHNADRLILEYLLTHLERR